MTQLALREKAVRCLLAHQMHGFPFQCGRHAKRTIRLVISLLFIWLLGCFSCSHSTEPPSNPPFLVALAGDDRSSFVGSYAVLEGSFMCSPPMDSPTYHWTQAETNPEKLSLFDGDRTQTLGFKREGTYRYLLRVSKGTTQSEPDTVTIQVGPNHQHLFADPKLEITIRSSINKPEGDLTQADLAMVDTLVETYYARPVTSLEGIASCVNLSFLNFPGQSIADLRPLSTLTHLEFLGIDQNYAIKDLSPLAGLTSLRSLNCDSDSITNLSPLVSLKLLRHLNVSFTQVTNVSVVANFPDLEELHLGNLQEVKDITALKHLTKLKLFNAFGCQLSDISALSDHPELDYVDLWFNHVSDISPLSASTKLVRLYLVGNQVQNISVLKNLPNLALLSLLDNKVSNILPLVENTGLGQGDLVDVQMNPLDTISANQYIPALKARGVIVLH